MKIFGHNINFFRKRINQLNIYHSYLRNDGYGGVEKHKKVSIEKFLSKARAHHESYTYGSISTKFNDLQYSVYDLDSEDKYNDFLQFHHNKENCVIFRSSKSGPDERLTNGSGTFHETRHYWAIVDENVRNLKNYNNVNWHVINDNEYVKFCKKNNSFDLRFTYETLDRKPIRIKTGDDVSENFKLFIKSFEKIIDEDGLEISTLISNDKELLTLYNRRKKLEKLTTKKDL